MKRLTFICAIAAGLLLAGIPQSALAGCVVRQRVVVRQQAVVAVEAVVTPVIATFVPIAVAVPQYSISYQPQAVPAAVPVPVKSECDLLKEKIAELQNQLDALKSAKPTLAPPAPVMPPADASAVPTVPPYLAILRAKCAVCHDAAVATAKGAKLVLLQGDQLSDLSDKRVSKLASAVYTGRMPKGGKLTDEEAATLIEWLDSRK